MSFTSVKRFELVLSEAAPYMAETVNKARNTFGASWEAEFDETLERMIGDDSEAMKNAAKGYVRFALDATRLQKKFEKELRYIPKTFDEASKAVYHNKDYMFGLYLPGILLSHYLWPHHYRQLLWFRENFLKLVQEHPDPHFCDIGLGTGFYSRQILKALPEAYGTGYDISEHALEYTSMQIEFFRLTDRFRAENRNIIINPPQQRFPFIVSVEVLEHLEDPVTYLKALRGVTAGGGRGFITAAITAPNEDHIYLYNNCQEVEAQLNESGFEVLAHIEEQAYAPVKDEPVPRLGAFIVN